MTLNSQFKNNKRQGFTIIEILIVLAIIMNIVVIAVAASSGNFRNTEVDKETTNLSKMYQNIDNFLNHRTISNLDNGRSVQSGFIPDGMFVEGSGSTTIIGNSFGGRVFINGSNPDSIGNVRGFSIEYTRVPQDYCVNFIQSQQGVGWDTFSVEGNLGVDSAQRNTNPRFFMTSNAKNGDTKGSQEISEFAIIASCDVVEDYVSINFVKSVSTNS